MKTHENHRKKRTKWKTQLKVTCLWFSSIFLLEWCVSTILFHFCSITHAFRSRVMTQRWNKSIQHPRKHVCLPWFFFSAQSWQRPSALVPRGWVRIARLAHGGAARSDLSGPGALIILGLDWILWAGITHYKACPCLLKCHHLQFISTKCCWHVYPVVLPVGEDAKSWPLPKRRVVPRVSLETIADHALRRTWKIVMLALHRSCCSLELFLNVKVVPPENHCHPRHPKNIKVQVLSFVHDSVDFSPYCQHTHVAFELLHSYEKGNSKTQKMFSCCQEFTQIFQSMKICYFSRCV